MKKYVFILFFGIFALLSFQNRAAAQDAPPVSGSRYIIKISHSQCRLWLYEKTANGLRLAREYKAGTAKIGRKIKLPLGLGYITKIDFAPVWRPTDYSREVFAKEKGIYLPAEVLFGDELNYMGAFKISLSHNVPGKGRIYRIHGVRFHSGEEKYIGTRVSGGCIRMFNEEGLELAQIVSVGTPVEIVP